MKRWMLLFLIFGLLAVPWRGQAETWQDTFQSQIKQWAHQLGSQDERFHSFTEADFEYHDLGPNTRQWLVTFHSRDSKIGYMVVGEDTAGFSLLEYGLGDLTLFDPSSVAPFLTGRDPISPHYAGLQSVWLSDTAIYDAKSGEKYPSVSKWENITVKSAVHNGASLTKVVNKGEEESNAWINPQATIQTQTDLLSRLENEEISFLGELFQRTVTAPFEVVGCHIWDQELFVELEDYGSRFIPFSHALQIGNFVQ